MCRGVWRVLVRKSAHSPRYYLPRAEVEPAPSAETTPLLSPARSIICSQRLEQEHIYDKQTLRNNTLQCPIPPAAASNTRQTIADTSKMAICPISLVKFVGTISLGLMTVRTSLSGYHMRNSERVIRSYFHTRTILNHPDRPAVTRISILTPHPT